MKEEKHKMVIQGNALYEIDLECLERKKAGKECGQEKVNFSEKSDPKNTRK